METIWFDACEGEVCFVDQTKLPGSSEVVRCTFVDRLIQGIGRLEIRGAPALGIAGAYGIALAAMRSRETRRDALLAELRTEGDRIRATRPTAVNLAWGIDRVIDAAESAHTAEEATERAIAEAEAIAAEDEQSCRSLGRHGASLVPDHATVLTHCNAGALACKGWGTALGVIRSARALGKDVRVIACETRPLFQGARLTAWELAGEGIDVEVIPDAAAAFLMRRGEIDLVCVGADRITRDAVFNKIGTYMHAVSARHHRLPFYVAAPTSTLDPVHAEREIAIEQRPREEVARCGGIVVVPDGVRVRNYAFDATPIDLVTAVITERGIFRPPLDIDRMLGHPPLPTG